MMRRGVQKSHKININYYWYRYLKRKLSCLNANVFQTQSYDVSTDSVSADFC
jgi:hypothetical protein